MFEVMVGEEVHTYDTRQEAIAAAKDLSTEKSHGMVSISDSDNRERMTYQGGELVSYDYETRRR